MSKQRKVVCNHQTSQGAEWRLTHVTDCPQATTPTLPPDRWLTHSLPGLRDNEEEVEEEYSASASSGPVSASFGSHWCNNSEQQVSGQTAAATGGAEDWNLAMALLRASLWHLENLFWTSLLVIRFPCSIQEKLSLGCTCTDYWRKSMKTEY